MIRLNRKTLMSLVAVAFMAMASCRRQQPSPHDSVIQIPNEQFVAYMKHYLDDGYLVRMVPKGNSMLPTLKNGEEVVTLKHAEEVRPNDIVLARVDNGHYVIHRVVKVNGNAVTLKGDHNKTTEKAKMEDVLAIMVDVQPLSGNTVGKKAVDQEACYMANPAFRIDAVDTLAWMVDTVGRQIDMHKTIVFNETAFFLWKRMGTRQFGLNDMKNALTEAYEVDDSVALGDCRNLLEEWVGCELVVPVGQPK